MRATLYLCLLFQSEEDGSVCPAVSQLIMYSSSSHVEILLTIVEVEGLNNGCTPTAYVLESLLLHVWLHQ